MPPIEDLDADIVIEALGLAPHPEGGWFAGPVGEDAPTPPGRLRCSVVHSEI